MKTIRNLDERFSRYFILKFRFGKKGKNCSGERARRNQRATHIEHREKDDACDEREDDTCHHHKTRGVPFAKGTIFLTISHAQMAASWQRSDDLWDPASFYG